jgi:PAS domain S-box-containing protein
MIGHYANTPASWPMLVTAAALLGLAVYAWRQRGVPGARPLAVTLGLAVPWACGAALEVAAVEMPTRIFWFEFQFLWPMAAATSGLWFALEYASLDRYLTGRVLWLLMIPSAVSVSLVLTNSAHHLVWQAVVFDGHVRAVNGPAPRLFMGIGYAFAMASSLVFLWLFVHSPLHRWPAALCLGGQMAARIGFALDAADINPVAPVDLAVLGALVTSVTYAIALFRFGMFAVVPVARSTVLEQMGEGMLILDLRETVLDVNPAAERILGLPSKQARGRRLQEVVAAQATAVHPAGGGGASDTSASAGALPSLITRGSGDAARTYALRGSPLASRRGFRLGYLVLLQDVTEQQRTQAQVVDQQRALATLRERDRVARELHDGLGQVLGYLKMQAHAARLLLARGQMSEADACLARMVSAAQDSHADIREYIVGSAAGAPAGSAFLPSLERCIHRFGEASDVAASLEVASGLHDEAFDPLVAAQLLRIIQEALTNARKHAGASRVRVTLRRHDGRAEAVVEDDGAGFDAAAVAAIERKTFGLTFMQERAEDVGGSVHVQSSPGGGTRILVSVPLRKGQA